MAYKLVHVTMAQELRFPTPAAAAQYADQFGGQVERWKILQAGTTERGQRPRASPS